jgi:hypothetical protein
MKKRNFPILLGACLLGAWIPALAHHSFQAEYDDNQGNNIVAKITGAGLPSVVA